MIRAWFLFITIFIYAQIVYSQKCVNSVSKETWGETFDSLSGSKKIVYRYKLLNCNNMTVRLINYGASLTSIIVPDSKGNLNDILLGFDDIEG